MNVNVKGNNNQVPVANGSGSTATATINQLPEKESVFTKPIFYIVLFVFIYACLLLLSVADLKEKGKIADATFTEIVLHPFSLLKSK
jgi:hypothetical protein